MGWRRSSRIAKHKPGYLLGGAARLRKKPQRKGPTLERRSRKGSRSLQSWRLQASIAGLHRKLKNMLW
jgi:hypothetical protein